jgi:hypothetical protein
MSTRILHRHAKVFKAMHFFISSWIYSDQEPALLPREYFFRNASVQFTLPATFFCPGLVHLTLPGRFFFQASLTILSQASVN